MKIAICGPGLAGSYLYRLLNQAGFGPITMFDKQAPLKTSCGIHPCAWGTSVGFEELVRYTGLNPANYILRSFDNIVMNGMKVKASAMVIDKPKLITDLLNGAKVLSSPLAADDFDRIIDATGFARAFLPPIGKDIVSACIQYRVRSQEKHEMSVDISNMGYAWCFPLPGNEYHIGAGSIRISPQRMLEKLGWLKGSSQICACAGKIRLTAPHSSLPFVDVAGAGKCPVWGVGESIGCVAPLIGEGIIPGLRSARLLLANWDDPEVYRRAVLKEFSWMKEERKLVDKAALGKRMSLFDVQVLKKSTERLKMNLNYNQGLSLLSSLARME